MNIFLSYATKDSNKLKIPQLVQSLENTPNVEKVWYWDRDSKDFPSIVKFMEMGISTCDAVLAVSTPASYDSEAVNQEIDLAIYMDKKIIPIFEHIENVRLLLRPKTGFQLKMDAFDSSLKLLSKIIFDLVSSPSSGQAEFKARQLREQEIKRKAERLKRERNRKEKERKDKEKREQDRIADEEKERREKEKKEQDKIAEEERFRKRGLEKYQGVWIYQKEIAVLKALESQGINISLQTKIASRGDFGFTVKGHHIEKLAVNSFNGWLESIPSNIGDLENVRFLYFKGHPLKSIPKSMCDLTTLTDLILENCQLTSLPENFGQLVNLTFLNILNNNFQSLPESFLELPSLESLRLEEKIEAFDKENKKRLKNIYKTFRYCNQLSI